MSKPSLVTRSLYRLLAFLPFILTVVISVPVVGIVYTETAKLIGLRSVPVPVVGTGSMYPSLFWSSSEGGPEDETKAVIEEYRSTPHLYRHFSGITILGHTYLHRQINIGDMVAFNNDKTIEILAKENKDTTAGFIKRIIAVPGDIVELRDGFLYRNDTLISEPYISSPRSSYGGTTLKDCTKLSIPPGNYFVLGDNRKVSSDSRYELGLIKEQDIRFILPYDKQQIYHSLWRDTDKDSELLGQPSLSASEFVSLVNDQRQAKGLGKLTLVPALAQSTTLRGEKLLFDQATSYSMQQAIGSANYHNIVLGEFVSHGHYSAQELLGNLLFNQDTAKQILDKDFSDLGLSALNREVDGCPTQIIVGHLGGYIPASYDSATLENWHKLQDNLRSATSSWEGAVGYNNLDQSKLSQLLVILQRRLLLTDEIIGVMEKKAWLSPDQEQRIKDDEHDADLAQTLAKELNNQ